MNPLANTSTDGATPTQIRVETDLLGRVTSYRHAHNRTTTFGYDQFVQLVTTNIQGLPAIGRTYDTTGRLDTLTYGGAVLADTTYDPTTKRMTRVDYLSGAGTAGNGTHGLFDVDEWGFSDSVDWNTGATDLTAHTYTRTPDGRVVDETIDGADPSTGNAYTYDALKRLTAAQVKTTGTTQTIDYGYAATSPVSCGTGGGILAGAAKNTNWSSAEIIGPDTASKSPYTYCYNKADQLVSSSDTAVGTVAYDTHGNTTQIFGETRTDDSADRHLTTTKGATSVTYTRDVTDRIITRNSAGTTQKYSFTGSGDAPSVILDANGANVVQATLSLPGGAMVTVNIGSAARTWSYPNLHGDIVGVANETGLKQGPTRVYDPYGNPVIGSTPDNATGDMDYGWLGQHQRPLEHQTNLQPIIEMGARQYSGRIGRFIEVDPVEGGSPNDYDYTNGDPINATDLAGTWPECGWCRNSWNSSTDFAKRTTRTVINTSVRVGTYGKANCVTLLGGCEARSYSIGGGRCYGNSSKCVRNVAKNRQNCRGAVISGWGVSGAVRAVQSAETRGRSMRAYWKRGPQRNFVGAAVFTGVSCIAGVYSGI